MMKEKIKDFAKQLQMEYTGVCEALPMSELKEYIEKRRGKYGVTAFEEESIEKRTDPRLTMKEAKSIIVCLVPYYNASDNAGNLSKYARIPDYHVVVMNRLEKICDFIRKHKKDAKLMPFVDSGPLADKYLAYKAGLGFVGKNSLFINERYGSFVFIGYIITDLLLEPDKPMEKECMDCKACICHCPGGALSGGYDFCAERCISYITQLKSLTEEQKEILSSQSSVYGCDVCQNVCPHNKNLPITPIEEFRTPHLDSLIKDELLVMSNREFRKKYHDFPFSWRGKSTIVKNFVK